MSFDLSKTDDNTCVILITNHEGQYYVKQWVFVPSGRLQQKINIEKINYDIWVRRKLGIDTNDETTNNHIINYKTIEDFVVSIPKHLGVEITHFAYDPYNADKVIQNLHDYEAFFNTKFEPITQNNLGRHLGVKLL
ncbi:terminase TerL endonuclease subunit [Cytobacillus horneckiae]|uniref:terminase TerL endonuclease subunit n=1 Tax=Cytobacillus horneckiae TaxID=549687 RepID=UPI003D9A72CA